MPLLVVLGIQYHLEKTAPRGHDEVIPSTLVTEEMFLTHLLEKILKRCDSQINPSLWTHARIAISMK